MEFEGSSEQLDLIPLDENTPRLKVAKANALASAQYELTSQEHRLLLVAIAQIRKDQTELFEQAFEVKDLVKHMDLNPKNAYRDLERISKGLMRKQVHIRNDDTGEWRMYQWVAKAYCERGTFGIKISDDLGPFLLGLVSKYTLYELGKILNMKSSYSIRLYEIIKQYEKLGVRTVSLNPKLTAQKSWDDFSRMMGYSPKTYSRFSNLNQRVLKPAIAEIEEFTEFKKISVKQIKFNRKTIALEFKWTVVDTLEDLPKHPLYGDVINLGVGEKVCRDLFAKYDEDRIARNLALAKKAHREKQIENPAGYFITALKDNYADPELPLAISDSADKQKVRQREPSYDHPLYEFCATDQEFLKLAAAEKQRGVPFKTYNEFHEYVMHQSTSRAATGT